MLKVLVIAVEPVATLGRREKDSIRLKAEQMARGQSADAEMLILRSEQASAQYSLGAQFGGAQFSAPAILLARAILRPPLPFAARSTTSG